MIPLTTKAGDGAHEKSVRQLEIAKEFINDGNHKRVVHTAVLSTGKSSRLRISHMNVYRCLDSKAVSRGSTKSRLVRAKISDGCNMAENPRSVAPSH